MKATIFVLSEFIGDVHSILGRLEDISISKYAQYKDAVTITYIPKGKRKARAFRKYSYTSPYVLILQGHHNLDLMQENVIEKADVKITKSKYNCFDKRYESDANIIIEDYIEKNDIKIIFDSRTVKKFDIEKKKRGFDI